MTSELCLGYTNQTFIDVLMRVDKLIRNETSQIKKRTKQKLAEIQVNSEPKLKKYYQAIAWGFSICISGFVGMCNPS